MATVSVDWTGNVFHRRVTDIPTLFREDWVDVHCVVQRTVTVWRIEYELWMLVGHTLY